MAEQGAERKALIFKEILSGKVNFSYKTISEIEEGLGIELFQAAAMEA